MKNAEVRIMCRYDAYMYNNNNNNVSDTIMYNIMYLRLIRIAETDTIIPQKPETRNNQKSKHTKFPSCFRSSE